LNNADALAPESIGIGGTCWHEPDTETPADGIQLVGNRQKRTGNRFRECASGMGRPVVFLDGGRDITFFLENVGIDPAHDALKLRKLPHHLADEVCLAQ